MRGIRKHMERLHISLLIYTDGFPLISELRLSQRSSLTCSLYCGKCFCKRSQIWLVCMFTLDTVQMQKRAKLWTCAHAHAKSIKDKGNLRHANRFIMAVLEWYISIPIYLHFYVTCAYPEQNLENHVFPLSVFFSAFHSLVPLLLPHLCGMNVESTQVSVCCISIIKKCIWRLWLFAGKKSSTLNSPVIIWSRVILIEMLPQ